MMSSVIRIGSGIYFHDDIRGIIIPSNPDASKEVEEEEKLEIKIMFRDGSTFSLVYETEEMRNETFEKICDSFFKSSNPTPSHKDIDPKFGITL